MLGASEAGCFVVLELYFEAYLPLFKGRRPKYACGQTSMRSSRKHKNQTSRLPGLELDHNGGHHFLTVLGAS